MEIRSFIISESNLVLIQPSKGHIFVIMIHSRLANLVVCNLIGCVNNS